MDNTDISAEKVHKVIGKPFKSGEEWKGNAEGRPPGSFSLKTLIINKLKEQPELREKLIADLLEKEQGLLIQMIDGRPKQDVEVAHKEAPQPIINLGNLTKDKEGVVIQDASAVPLLE